MKWPEGVVIPPVEEGLAEILFLTCQQCAGKCGDLTMVLRNAHIEPIDGSDELVSTGQITPEAAAAIADTMLRAISPGARRQVILRLIAAESRGDI